MRKLIAIAAVTLSLAACHGASSTEATSTDSTVVKADTAAVVLVDDSTKVVDSVKAAK